MSSNPSAAVFYGKRTPTALSDAIDTRYDTMRNLIFTNKESFYTLSLQ